MRKSRAVGHDLFIAMTQKSDQLSLAAEEALLTEESTSRETTSQQVPSDPMFTLFTNLNKSLGAMADSMLSMNQSLKRLRSEPSDATDDDPASKKSKTCSTDVMSASEDDEEDSDKDIAAFCGNTAEGAPKEKPCARLEQTDNNDPLLSEIAEDFLNADEAGPAIDKQFATFVNSQWSKKLSDSKLKDKAMKYLRPTNCETLTTPRVNPEIWEKMTHSVKQHDLRSSATQKTIGTVGAVLCKSMELLLKMKKLKEASSDSDIQSLVKMNADAIALLGHAHIELSHRRREEIKPHLHKDYAGLCASHVPVKTLLFGNDLQTQLNNIRASNRISTTAVGNRSTSTGAKGRPSRNYQKSDRRDKPFLWKSRQWKTPSKPSFRQQDQGKKQH